MAIQWPPEHIHNEFGIATLSLGNWHHHNLEGRLKEAAKAGFKWIDLFDDDWAAYLSESNLNPDELWEATEANLKVASRLGELIKSLGMRIACTQPCRKIEGIKDPVERRNALDSVAKRFPFMRAWDTDLVFLCANIRRDPGVTSDFKTVAKDLAELGEMAELFSKKDGGPMIRIGYEGLSWAVRNTWSSSWEVVRAANRSNVGLVLDAFNILAVEFADPYNPAGHGRIYSTIEESIQILQSSLAALAVTVPSEKIFFFQVADAELMDPKTFRPPEDSFTPSLLPWSRGHRLFPCESEKGGYMPVDMVIAAVLATGYRGPISLEVFNDSLSIADVEVPEVHARRGYASLERLVAAMQNLQPFWKR